MDRRRSVLLIRYDLFRYFEIGDPLLVDLLMHNAIRF